MICAPPSSARPPPRRCGPRRAVAASAGFFSHRCHVSILVGLAQVLVASDGLRLDDLTKHRRGKCPAFKLEGQPQIRPEFIAPAETCGSRRTSPASGAPRSAGKSPPHRRRGPPRPRPIPPDLRGSTFQNLSRGGLVMSTPHIGLAGRGLQLTHPARRPRSSSSAVAASTAKTAPAVVLPGQVALHQLIQQPRLGNPPVEHPVEHRALRMPPQ